MLDEPKAATCPFAGSAPVEDDYDHNSRAFAQDRLAISARLRENGITYAPSHGGFYVLARYDDVRRAGQDHRLFLSGRDQPDLPRTGNMIPSPPRTAIATIPPETDPPLHGRYRGAMAPLFTTRAAKASVERLRHWTTVCIDEVIESGRVDVVADIAAPLSFLFFFEQLGLPVQEWELWRAPLHVIQTYAYDTPEMRQALIDDQRNVAALEALTEERRAKPREDMISHLAAATDEHGELLPIAEAAALARIVLLGSVDSQASLLSQSLVHLEDHPQDLRRLLDDPSLIPTANEEFIRYFTPGTHSPRTVSGETEIHGQALTRGDRVSLHWLAANHDPDQFPDADRVVIDRSPNPHLAFGTGVHTCIGLHIARTEANVVLEEVLARMPDYRIDREAAVEIPTIGLFSGYWSLPATFTPGARLQEGRLPGRAA